jgi:hypothetical protein
VRRFGRRDVISAFTEVYTDPSRPAPVRLTARVTPVKGGRTFTPATTPLVGEAGRAGYLMRLRLADLSPGDYVLTVEATSSLQRTAMRQVPFSVVAE